MLLTILGAIEEGWVHRRFFLLFFVIGVSIKAGLIVTTETLYLFNLCLKPEAKVDTIAFALPYT